MRGVLGNNYPKGYWEQFKDDLMWLYTSKTMSTYQLADKYNTTPTTITRYLKQWGVYDKSTAYNKVNKYEERESFYIGYTRNDNYEFYIDKKYYDLIRSYCWHKHQDGYLRTCIGHNENGGNIYKLMHVMIMEAEGHVCSKGEEIDHINGKPNDNRIENLRVVTHEENMKNVKLPSNNTSGHKGVYYNKLERKWKAMIRKNKKQIHLGTFDTKEEAVEARRKAENEYYGEHKRKEEYLFNGTR